MAKKNIVFVSFDEEYIATIEYKFAKLIEDKASVEFITDKTGYSRIMNMPKKIDVLILPEGTRIEHPEFFSKTKIYCLTENDQTTSSDCIYKYLSIKSIVEKIDSNLISDTVVDNDRGTKVVGVFSPAGGSGNTLTALSIAYRLKKKGKHVLYISTTPYQDFTYYMQYEDVLGTAFGYQCSINIKNALKLVQSEIRNEEFDFLPPFKNLPVSYQVKFSTYAQIINYLKNKNTYDYIVVELSPEIEADKLIFLKACERTVLVTTQGRVAVTKLEKFLENMLDYNSGVAILCNRYDRNQIDYLSNSEVARKYEFGEYIEEYSSAIDFNMIKGSQLFERVAMCIE